MSLEYKKISALTTGTPLDTDVIPYVDLVAGETKKATKLELKGDTGDTGPSGTIAVGTVTTVSPATPAAVTNVGSTTAAVFDFDIPQGETGATGATGPTGPSGTIAVGTVTTVSPATPAAVTNVGSTTAAIFDFDIPQGATGATGATGAVGIDWQGAWSAGTYTQRQAVSHNGSSWYVTASSTTEEPSISANDWDLIALKGTDGIGTGDVSSDTATSVDAEIALFKSTTGKLIQRATGTGVAIVTSGVLSTKTNPSGAFVGTTDTQTLTGKTIVYENNTLTNVAGTSATQTLTNKRINPRLVTAASYTTDTGSSLDVSTCDQFEITAQAGALKFNNPGGTPVGGQKLIIRIKDNGTARALTYDTQFRAMGVSLPTTTVLSKTLYMGFIYNATDTKWDLVAVAQEQ